MTTHRIRSGILLVLLAWAAGLAACSSAPGPGPGKPAAGGGPEGQAEPGTPAPDLPVMEDNEARNRRLRQLEQACDQWYAALSRQEYDRMESLEMLLRTYTQEHFDAVVSDLKHGYPRYRRTMAAALGFSGRAEAVPPLLDALKDQYYEVVLHSLMALYMLADPDKPKAKDAPPIVIDAEAIVPYLQHPRTEVRSNAAMALSRVVTPETPKSVLLALIGTSEDQDAATRLHALAALGATKDREAFPHLVKALHDPIQLVRIRAIIALGRLGDAAAVPYLIEVLARGDEKPDVKSASAKALGVLLGEKDSQSVEPAFWSEKAAKKETPAAPDRR